MRLYKDSGTINLDIFVTDGLMEKYPEISKNVFTENIKNEFIIVIINKSSWDTNNFFPPPPATETV